VLDQLHKEGWHKPSEWSLNPAENNGMPKQASINSEGRTARGRVAEQTDLSGSETAFSETGRIAVSARTLCRPGNRRADEIFTKYRR